MNLFAPFYPVTKTFFRTHHVCSDVFTSTYGMGLTPQKLKSIYGITDEKNNAEGIKIAIISAFDSPDIKEDTAVFCNTFGMPVPLISVYNMSESPVQSTRRWLIETALDVQWASTFARGAQIYAVFARDSTIDSMLEAVSFAKSLMPDVISMSFGIEESGSFVRETSLFAYTDIIFTASSGDIGGKVSFPSSSPYVLSVGGSVPYYNSDFRRTDERAWENSGGGISDLFEMPYYQRAFSPLEEMADSRRATPDVCFFADDKRGAAVYVSSLGGWSTVGGTSLSCACMAGICACVLKRNPSVKQSGIHSFLYNLAGKTAYSFPQSRFFDVISGSSGRFSAKKGWDFCTGLGVYLLNDQIIDNV